MKLLKWTKLFKRLFRHLTGQHIQKMNQNQLRSVLQCKCVCEFETAWSQRVCLLVMEAFNPDERLIFFSLNEHALHWLTQRRVQSLTSWHLQRESNTAAPSEDRLWASERLLMSLSSNSPQCTALYPFTAEAHTHEFWESERGPADVSDFIPHISSDRSTLML